jgi:hypothetical protein
MDITEELTVLKKKRFTKLTYSLTLCSSVYVTIIDSQLVKKFPTLCGSQMFITVLTRSILTQTNWVHVLQFSFFKTHLIVRRPSKPVSYTWFLLYAFPLSFSPKCATCPENLTLGFITRIILGEESKTFIHSSCNLLQACTRRIYCF